MRRQRKLSLTTMSWRSVTEIPEEKNTRAEISGGRFEEFLNP